ncbi:MAG: 4Fe-4S binding protein [Candidatus Eremiobacteraeota bacterium]|nr:4Fe-4S binding protein [Candidatus Eremiobacteraeota bacterium]
MRCANCGEENPEGSKNCQRCGAKLETRTCTKCGGVVRGKSKFCIHCGATLTGEASPSPRRRASAPPQAPPVYTPPPPQPSYPQQQQYPYAPPSQMPPPQYPAQGQSSEWSEPPMADRDRQSLKDKTILLKEQFGAVIKKGNYREVLQDKNHPATQAFIDFIAWGVSHFYGFAALIGAITFLGIFLGGWGVVFGLALAFVYATYKKEIDEKVREMKSAGDMSQPAPVNRPSYRYVTASRRDHYFQIHSNCTGCGICVPICPTQAIFQISQQFIIDQTRCNQCGECSYQCPVRAIIKVRD